MRLLDRLIFRELIGPILNSVFLFMMLLFASAVLFKLTDLLVQGVPVGIVLRLTVLSLPAFVTQTLPMAMLLGTLLAFGRISGDSEHIALFACGISFYRVVRPVVILGFIVSLIAMLWNETVVPYAQSEFYNLLDAATEKTRTINRPLLFTDKRDDGTVLRTVYVAGGLDAREKTLRNVTITQYSDDPRSYGQVTVLVHADRAVASDLRGKDWEFYRAHVIVPNSDPTSPATGDAFLEYSKTLPQNATVGRELKGIMQAEVTDNRRMTFQQLRVKINKERAQGSLNTLGDEVDLWEKISLPFASLIFGLVGAPLGIRPQRGSKAMGFGVAILIIFVYWVVYRWLYVVGKGGGVLTPFVASFTADALGLIAAVILVARTRQ